MATYVVDATYAWAYGVATVECSASLDALVGVGDVGYATCDTAWGYGRSNGASNVGLAASCGALGAR